MEPAVTYGNLGLPPEWLGAMEWVFPTWARAHALDKGEAVNFLKGAIVTADRIVTVSKVRMLHIIYNLFCLLLFYVVKYLVFVHYSIFFFLRIDTHLTKSLHHFVVASNSYSILTKLVKDKCLV